ncbi:hypothetical protein SAMN05660479_01884 [Microbulbifer thermotolerans]|nr:hypothetical protein SAMN05660479_01884 [Microbulbifer thermotolerans]
MAKYILNCQAALNKRMLSDGLYATLQASRECERYVPEVS